MCVCVCVCVCGSSVRVCVCGSSVRVCVMDGKVKKKIVCVRVCSGERERELTRTNRTMFSHNIQDSMRESMLAHIHINTCMSMLEFVLHKVSVLSSLCEKDRNRVCLLVCVCVCMRV